MARPAFVGSVAIVAAHLVAVVALAQDPASEGPWEGWATTTIFGSGDGPWGDDPASQVYVNVLNNETANRMGAAVPWRYYFRWYGSKAGETSAVYGSITGKNTEKACFLMQPVVYGPGRLGGTSDGAPVTCTGAGCADINDDAVAASYEESVGVRRTFPPYLIVPFEGCGGDCKAAPDGPGPDCMNSCAQGTDFLAAIQGRFSDTTSPACSAMRVLCGGKDTLTPGSTCTWTWDDSVRSNFAALSRPLGCSPETSWGVEASKLGTHVNWCSGQNMHFDIAMDVPFYRKSGSNAAITTDQSNIVVRYKRVSCAIRGTFDPQDPCARGDVKCGGHGQCVPGTQVCNCDAGFEGSTCSIATRCVGVTCSSGQQCDADTGLCKAKIAPSLAGCSADRWSCQDPSMATALASWCSGLLGQATPAYCGAECAASADMPGCATCILNLYGLSQTCRWTSGSSAVTSSTTPAISSSSTIGATTRPSTSATTSGTTRPATSASTTTTSRPATSASTSSTTRLSTPATTMAPTTSSLATSAPVATTTRSGTASDICALQRWSCQDATIPAAMSSWCTNLLAQRPPVYCATECAATADIAGCAGCILRLYGYADTCTWSSGSSTSATIPTTASTSTTRSTLTTLAPTTTSTARSTSAAASSTTKAPTSTTGAATTTARTTTATTRATTTTSGVATTTTRAATSTTNVATTTTKAATTATKSVTTTTMVATSAAPTTAPGSASTSSRSTVVVENVDMPQAIVQCVGAEWAPVNDVWSFRQIARAFYEYGVKPWNFPSASDASQHIDDCVAALTIAAGECQPSPSGGCSASGSGASGVFQTDFLRTMPGYPATGSMSLCASAYGAGYMAAPFFADAAQTKASTLSYAGGAPSAFYTCAGAPRYVNNYTACPDPSAQPGVLYSNFIGPFCHKGFSMRWSSCDPRTACCVLFNGGGNSGQPPFPNYYLQKASEAESVVGATFRSICTAAATPGRLLRGSI